MKMELRKARKEDIPAIMRIIAQARKSLAERKIDQWQDGYPDEEAFLLDIEKGCCYLAVEKEKTEQPESEIEHILGVAAMILDGEPDYDTIYEGAWLGNDSYITVHRVAVEEGQKRKGVASFLLSEAERIAKEQKLSSLRMDTHRDNQPMQTCLIRNGLKRCGIIYLKRDRAERIAFEKRFDT